MLSIKKLYHLSRFSFFQKNCNAYFLINHKIFNISVFESFPRFPFYLAFVLVKFYYNRSTYCNNNDKGIGLLY